MIKSRRKQFLVPVLLGLFLSACATSEPGESRKVTPTKKVATGTTRGAQKSATITPTRSAELGPVINHKNRNSAALIAAVGGGLASADVGNYMDQHAKELQAQLESEIQREEITIVKRPSDNALLISMTSPTGFDNLSSVIKPGYLTTLSKIAPVLNQYGKTMLTVIGYTENVGPDAGNQRLAERRAQSVSNYFITQKVNLVRLQSYALGEPQARADNSTEADRQLNRRMELWVQPVVAK